MAALNKHQILGAVSSAPTLRVDVPEWGGEVFMRIMSVGERDEYENEWIRSKDRGMPNFRSKFLAKVLCDEAGARIFTDKELDELAKLPAVVMNRLWQQAMEYNALQESHTEGMAGN